MKKSLQGTLFKTTILLLFAFIFSIVVVNIVLTYNSFLDKKEQIKEEIIKSKKKIMKRQVDFMLLDIENEKIKFQDEMKNSLKNKVDTAYNIASNLYAKHKNNPEIQSIIIESLRKIRFHDSKKQYIYMTKIDGKVLLADAFKKLEGQNLFKVISKTNQKTLKEIALFIKDKESGFYEYLWEDLKTSSLDEKITYLRYFEPLDCYISANLLLKDIDTELKNKFITKLDKYRFGDKMNNYIFANTYDGYALTYPAKNKYVYDVEDKNGLKVVQELIKIAKNGEGFLSYVIPLGEDIGLEKISYVKGVSDWQIYIGVGKTLKDIKSSINAKRKELLNNLIADLALISFFGILSLIIFYIIFNKIKYIVSEDINNLTSNIEKLVTKNEIIKKDEIVFNEFDNIAENANKIIDIKTKMEEELKRKELIMHQQSKMAAMGDMLENIAHQWRQPLSVITVCASGIQLKKQFGNIDDAYLDKSLASIHDNAKYLSSTIDDFRNFFLDDKKTNIFKISDVIDTALKLVDSKFKNKDIEIIKELEDIEVQGFRNELIQVVLIILNNAKDALENIDTFRYIFIKTYQKDQFFYIEFKDNAKGIKESNLSKIFEPYFTTKHKSQGTGIGLYMVQEIISKHMKGEISVKNDTYIYEKNEYTGAKFSFKIPKKI